MPQTLYEHRDLHAILCGTEHLSRHEVLAPCALLCLSPVADGVEHLFTGFLVIHLSSTGQTTIQFFCPFCNWVVYFFVVEMKSLYMF